MSNKYRIGLILLTSVAVLSATFVFIYSNFSSVTILEKITHRNGYSILEETQNVAVEFRIPPEYVPKKQGDTFHLHHKIYDDYHTKIFLENVAWYSPPKNNRNIFIELKFEYNLKRNSGNFVSPNIYTESEPGSYRHVMFEPQYFNDEGEELDINDENGKIVVFFPPSQISDLQGGLTLKYEGFNLIEYSKN